MAITSEVIVLPFPCDDTCRLLKWTSARSIDLIQFIQILNAIVSHLQTGLNPEER